jgi:hypothetical protein
MLDNTLAPGPPVIDVSVCPSEDAPGMYAVAFRWEPGSEVPVDHYRVVLTRRPILMARHREHRSEVRNLSRQLSWLVFPGESLWITVTALGADGERSLASQLGVDALGC